MKKRNAPTTLLGGLVLALLCTACPTPDAGPCSDGPTHHGDIFIGEGSDPDLFSRCEEVQGNLFVQNTLAAEIVGVENIRHLGGTLQIRGNSQLASLDGLSGLEEVADGVIIIENPKLQHAEAVAFADALNGGSGPPGTRIIADNGAEASPGE